MRDHVTPAERVPATRSFFWEIAQVIGGAIIVLICLVLIALALLFFTNAPFYRESAYLEQYLRMHAEARND